MSLTEFYFLAEQTVHTSGINVEGVVTTAGSVVVLLSPFFWLLRSSFSNVLDRKLTPIEEHLHRHDVEIAEIRGYQRGHHDATEQINGPRDQRQPKEVA